MVSCLHKSVEAFAEETRFKDIVRDGFSVENIVRNLSQIEPRFRFVPGETLIFFDELQEFPEIATSFKFFAQDGRYDVICSGSLLGINMRRIKSFSVGYQETETMRSMDFGEFLRARGYTAVQLEDVYGQDIRKYAEGLDPIRIQSVFDSIVPQLARKNKKFQLSAVVRGARRKDYWGCIDWLKQAGAELAYFKRENATLEMDFFLRDGDRLVPVEVKSENARGRSLRLLIDGEHYPDIRWGVKLVHGNVGFANRILTLPQWAAFLLPRLVREFQFERMEHE